MKNVIMLDVNLLIAKLEQDLVDLRKQQNSYEVTGDSKSIQIAMRIEEVCSYILRLIQDVEVAKDKSEEKGLTFIESLRLL